MDSSTERQRAEYWKKGWKRLVHHAWRVLGPMHPLSLRISRRFLRAAANASLSAELERVRAQLAKARKLNYSIDCASLTVQRDNAQTQLTEARKEAEVLREIIAEYVHASRVNVPAYRVQKAWSKLVALADAK